MPSVRHDSPGTGTVASPGSSALKTPAFRCPSHSLNAWQHDIAAGRGPADITVCAACTEHTPASSTLVCSWNLEDIERWS